MTASKPVAAVDPSSPGRPQALSMQPPSPTLPIGGTAESARPLENSLIAVEFRLTALGEALRLLDARAIDSHASELHRALAQAIDRFADAAREGPIALGLRQRLALASGRVAAQRNALAQATAALDRAIDSLLPALPQAIEPARAADPAQAR